jgi:hypothetical protein
VRDPNGLEKRGFCRPKLSDPDRKLYSLEFLPELPGKYHVTVLNGQTVASEFDAEIRPPPATATEIGAISDFDSPPPMVGVPYFLTRVRIENGGPEDLHVSVLRLEKHHVLPSPADQIKFSENGDGIYDVNFIPSEVGDFMIRIPGIHPKSVMAVKKAGKAEFIPVPADDRKQHSTGSPVLLGKLHVTGTFSNAHVLTK